MSDRIPTQRPQTPAAPPAGRPAASERSRETSEAKGEQARGKEARGQKGGDISGLLDRYTPKTLNEVIRNLKGLLNFRAGKGYELASKADHQTQQEGVSPEGQALLHSLFQGEATELGGAQKLPAEILPDSIKQELKKTLDEKGKPFAKSGSEKGLSLFEKVFLARYEGGLSMGEQTLPEGKQSFAMKTEEQQQKFFLKTSPLAQEKKSKLAEIKAAVFRGLFNFVTKDGQKLQKLPANLQEQLLLAGTLVSDLTLANGRVEKFARMELKGQTLLQQLATLLPGDAIGQTLLAEMAGGADLTYLSLSHQIVRPELLLAVSQELGMTVEQLRFELGEAMANGDDKGVAEAMRRIGQGMALSSRAEQMASQALDLNWRTAVQPKDARPEIIALVDRREASAGSGLAGFLGLFGKKRRRTAGYDTEIVPGFVPWYRLVMNQRNWKQHPKWFVILTYFVCFSTVGFLLYYLINSLLLQR